MAVVHEGQAGVRLSRREAGDGRLARLPIATRLSDAKTIVAELTWGLGDVLLSTSAIHEFKRIYPDKVILFQTFVRNQTQHYQLQYPNGSPAQMLWHNPDITRILDVRERLPQMEMPVLPVKFRYAEFGGPSLDYPIQAHYWENLGLEWEPGQRFDARYVVTPDERRQAHALAKRFEATGPYLAVTPRGGWPGKLWRDDHWGDLLTWAVRQGWRPIVLAGERIRGAPWDQRGVLNLSGTTDVRQAGAILEMADRAVLIEGMASNLRFALGKPAILLTCATRVGTQIWTPSELTTEVRMLDAQGAPTCEECMWRRWHVKDANPRVPPANVKSCGAGKSLRDIPAKVVIEIIESDGVRKSNQRGGDIDD